jgi:DNA polymerase-3 subunit gamma/tau
MAQYIVSARKYRPDTFGTLVGQDNIAQTLKNSILRGQLAHAYLFCGPRGVGKTTTARIFAKMINCSDPSDGMEPCGKCESCLSFAEGRSYCIHELDAASNNGVEDIKTLMEQVRIPPQVGRYSVYIIDEVHMLSQAAFNAFLKTLEEPPAHAIFILATTEKHKILPTILSRCQTYDFNRITVDNIVRNLRMVASNEGITIDEESLHVIAHKADGAMRDALTIFDQTVAFCGTDVQYQDVLRNLNVLDYEYSFSLVDAFLRGDYPSALLTFDEVLTKGFNALHFVAALSSHLRDLLVSKSAGLNALLELPDSLRARYKEQADRCTLPFLYEALNITTTCESGYRASVNPRLHIEFALMRLSFILTRMQAPAVSPAQPAATVPQAAPAAVQSKPAVPAESAPAAPAQPAPASPVPAQPQRRERAARPGAAAASAKSLVEKEPEVKNDADTGSAPAEETLKAKWPELAKEYASKPRMASMLSTTTLKIEGDDTKRTVTFMVDNEAQKDWVESKLLHDLEGKYQRIVGSPRVALRVDVTPHEEVKPLAYMPEDKAKELMAENDEVKSLVKDLGLDIK